MGDWRGSRELPGRKLTSRQNRKPPTGSWKPTVPAWEKEFCETICLVPWWKVCETKKIMALYENVVQWNDSAGEEAFSNAKKRFWARINGLPCDVSLPDPDIYIDEIDWDSIDDVDPELLLALEQEAVVAEKTKGDSGNSEQPGSTSNNWENFVVFSSHHGNNNPFPSSGWDDGDEWVRAANRSPGELNRWEDDAENNEQAARSRNLWDGWDLHPDSKCGALITSSGWHGAGTQRWQVNHNTTEYGWGNDYGSSWRCHDWNHGFAQFSSYEPVGQGKRNWAYGTENDRKRGGGRYGSRYNKSTRYQSGPGNAYSTNGGWWNCSGRKRADHFTRGSALVGK